MVVNQNWIGRILGVCFLLDKELDGHGLEAGYLPGTYNGWGYG
jgi:hypothetical protein